MATGRDGLGARRKTRARRAVRGGLALILLSGVLALPVLPVHADATAYLFEAAERGTASEVKAALEAGADPNAIEINSGMTALHFLAVRNDLPSVIAASIAALIEGGANPAARGEKNSTALHWAAAHNPNPSIIAALIEGDADPNARMKDGATPLHLTPMFISRPSVIAALIEGGADPNARMKAGITPLHVAAMMRDANPAVIVALIEAGADPGAHDEDGKTPFDYAKKNEALKGTEAYRLLKEGRFE